MRCAITAAAALGLLLVGVAPVHAQGNAPQERIDSALARAGQVGIPVALLESKIAEGKAKGYPQERIAAAIERRLGALERARQVLRGQADAAATLSLAADAMEAGVSESVLKALASSAPGDRRNVAIAALTDLVARGQPPEAALERVQDALKRGSDALSNLPAEALQGSRSGRAGGQQSSGSGRGNGQGDARGGQGVPSAVPAPGQPSQAGRPDNPGRGNADSPGRGNADPPGRGNPDPPGGGDPDPPGRGNPDPPGGGNPDPPGRGNPDPPGGGNPDPPGRGNPDPPGRGNPDPPGGGNPDPPGRGNPDPPGRGNPDPPGRGNPDPPGRGNPDPGVGNPDTPGRGNPGSGRGNSTRPGRGTSRPVDR